MKKQLEKKSAERPGDSNAQAGGAAALRGNYRISGSVHASIAQEIGLRIVRGDYAPGSILPNEAAWATSFGVSRSAVREAIKMLMAKNLLSSRPKIGSRVEPRDRWNLFDRDILNWYAQGPDRHGLLKALQQLRHIIEPEAVAMAATHRSEEQMAVISNACADMANAQSLSARSEADVRFHLGILKASGNELLFPLGVLIESVLENLFHFVTREAKDLHHAQDLHNRIEKCIRQQKPQAARIAARKLMENTDGIIQNSQRRQASGSQNA
jgi:DNA-binding FadR family transcriptional regulator